MEWSNSSLHLPSFLEYHLFNSELTSEIKFSPDIKFQLYKAIRSQQNQ